MLTDSIFFLDFFSSNKKLSLNVNKCNLGNSNYYKCNLGNSNYYRSLGVKFVIKLSLEQIYVKILVEKYMPFLSDMPLWNPFLNRDLIIMNITVMKIII